MIAHHLYNYNSNRLTLNQGYVYKNYKTIKIIVFDKKKKKPVESRFTPSQDE